MSGLVIKVDSEFNRTLEDLSFIPLVKPEPMLYFGIYKKDLATSSKNNAPFGTHSPYSYGGDNISYTENSIIMVNDSGTVGIRTDSDNVPENVTLSAVFQSVQLPDADTYNFWPLVVVWANSGVLNERQYPGLFSIGLWKDQGVIKLAMRSGNITETSSRSDYASIPLNGSLSTIYVTASRDVQGFAIMNAVINGVSHTVKYKFDQPEFPEPNEISNHQPRIFVGSVKSRPITSVEIMSASAWDVAMNSSELEQANARQVMVF